MKITPSIAVNVVLSIVILSSMLFVELTTSQSVYDPWCDQDNDGDIDIYDIVPAAMAYGTTGDPTRNVTVTNFPNQQPDPAWKLIDIAEHFNLTWFSEESGNFIYSETVDLGIVNIGGYSRMMLFMKVENYSNVGGTGDGPIPHAENYARIFCELHSKWGSAEEWGRNIEVHWNNLTYHQSPILFSSFKYLEQMVTTWPTLKVTLYGVSRTPEAINLPTTISGLVSVSIYLRNE